MGARLALAMLLLALAAASPSAAQIDNTVRILPAILIDSLNGTDFTIYEVVPLSAEPPAGAPTSTLALHAYTLLSLVHVDPEGVLREMRLAGVAREGGETFYVYKGTAYNSTVVLVIGDKGHFLITTSVNTTSEGLDCSIPAAVVSRAVEILTGLPNASALGPHMGGVVVVPFQNAGLAPSPGAGTTVRIAINGLPVEPWITLWCTSPDETGGFLVARAMGFAPRLRPAGVLTVNKTILDALVEVAREQGLEGELWLAETSLGLHGDRLLPVVTVASSGGVARVIILDRPPWALPYRAEEPDLWEVARRALPPLGHTGGGGGECSRAGPERAGGVMELVAIVAVAGGALGAVAAQRFYPRKCTGRSQLVSPP